MFIHRNGMVEIATPRVEGQQSRASVLIIQMHGCKEEESEVIDELVRKVLDMCATDAKIYLNICYAGLPGNLGPALLKASKDKGLDWTVWASTGEVQGGVHGPTRSGNIKLQAGAMQQKLSLVKIRSGLDGGGIHQGGGVDSRPHAQASNNQTTKKHHPSLFPSHPR